MNQSKGANLYASNKQTNKQTNKQSKLLLVTVFISMAMVSGLAFSGSQTGKVSWVKIRDNGLVIFGMGVRTDYASCASANPHYWVIKDENSQGGKMQVSAVLAALATKSTVEVVGTGLCDPRLGDAENARDIQYYTN